MTRYYKLSGGGNDFLALAEPELEPTTEEIAAWCARGLSAGADGLFVLRRLSESEIEMRYFNADGRPADLCLNGTRCAARLAFELGWTDGPLTIATGAGEYAARAAGAHEVEVDLPIPTVEPTHLRLTHEDTVWDCWSLDVGVPHLVIFWDRPMAEAPIGSVGPALRRHPDLGEDGSNIDFVRFSDRHHVEIRSFERGVEAETLACGTGVLAAVAVGVVHGRADLPVTALTRSGLEIGIAESERIARWSMRGDARLVASGSLAPGASIAPSAPDW